MLRWVVESGLKFRRVLIALAAVAVAVGVIRVSDTRTDALPEFNPPMVEVQTEALGLSAEEVEQLITVPLEQDLLVGVPFLEEIESVSLPGLSSVMMTFEPGTDLLDARQVVQERLTQAVGIAGLPAVAKLPQMIQPLSSTSRVSMIKLSSDRLTPIELSVMTRWVIGPRLMSVPGVANVVTWGNRERQLQVLVDPARLAENDTTLGEVVSTAGNALEVSPLSFLQASSPGTGGFIDTPNQRLNIFHEQAITTAAELARVPVEGQSGGGTPLALGDVASVVEDHQPLIGDAVCAGGEQCLLLVVEKFPGANTGEVTDGVAAALDALRPGLTGVQMDSSVYRPAGYVESSFTNLGLALLAGALLLALLLALALWSWRSALVAVGATATSVATALLVLQLRDVSVNLMIAAGLVIGLTVIVQDVVHDVDGLGSALRRRNRAAPRVSAWKTVVDTSTRLRLPLVYAALIVAAAVVPVFVMRHEAGAFLPPVALSYLLAVAASMAVALLITPALALMLLTRQSSPAEPPVAMWLHWVFDRRAPRLLTRAGVALSVLAGFATIGIASTVLMDGDLRPALKERDVLVHVEAAPGTSLPRMTELTRGLVEELTALPGVAGVGSHVGRAVMADEIVDVNAAEVWVNLTPDADHDATMARIDDVAAGTAGLRTEVLTYSDEVVDAALGRSEDDLVVRVYGENESVLDRKADEIRALVADVRGVTTAAVDRVAAAPAVEVEVDLESAQELGVKPGDVRRAAAMLLGGITVGNLFDEQKVFDVVVWGEPGIRDSAANIERLLVDTPGGEQVPLGRVADVRVVPNPTEIRHESVASYLDVTAQVDGRTVADAATDVESALSGVTFPLDHHAEVLGGYAEQQADLWRVLGAGLAAALAIFLLLQAAFGSWRLAALAFVSLPVAVTGSAVAVLLTGGTLTIGSVAGTIGVLGLAARYLVTTLRGYQRARIEQPVVDDRLVLTVTRETLVPTVLSMLGAALLLAPFAVLPGVTGFEIVHPMAVAFLGGLVTTVVVVLFIVPAVYLRYGGRAPEDTSTADLYDRVPQHKGESKEPAVLQRIRRLVAVSPLVATALLVSSCAGAVVAESYVIDHEPAKVKHVDGQQHDAVVLERRAAERLRVRTTEVIRIDGQLVVPSTAVFVDTAGSWWVFTNPKRLTYVRHEVDLERQHDGRAYLSGGPSVGARVVTQGVAQIAGVEDGVGH